MSKTNYPNLEEFYFFSIRLISKHKLILFIAIILLNYLFINFLNPWVTRIRVDFSMEVVNLHNPNSTNLDFVQFKPIFQKNFSEAKIYHERHDVDFLNIKKKCSLRNDDLFIRYNPAENRIVFRIFGLKVYTESKLCEKLIFSSIEKMFSYTIINLINNEREYQKQKFNEYFAFKNLIQNDLSIIEKKILSYLKLKIKHSSLYDFLINKSLASDENITEIFNNYIKYISVGFVKKEINFRNLIINQTNDEKLKLKLNNEIIELKNKKKNINKLLFNEKQINMFKTIMNDRMMIGVYNNKIDYENLKNKRVEKTVIYDKGYYYFFGLSLALIFGAIYLIYCAFVIKKNKIL